MLNRTLVFLIFHAIILTSIFALRYLGFATDHILIIAAVLMSLEAIYLTLFTKAIVNKVAGSLKEIESEMAQIREDALETVKIQRALLYAGHQIKTIQSDLDALKKRNGFKSSGNGHHRRSQAPTVTL